MLLLKSSNRLWDEILKFQPTHFSIITYGIQRTISSHSPILTEALRSKSTRIVLCPNNSTTPSYLRFRETQDCHTKFIISHRDKAAEFFLTSMNLEIGLWENFLYKVTYPAEQKAMLQHFNTKWESANDPTPLPTFDHLIKWNLQTKQKW